KYRRPSGLRAGKLSSKLSAVRGIAANHLVVKGLGGDCIILVTAWQAVPGAHAFAGGCGCNGLALRCGERQDRETGAAHELSDHRRCRQSNHGSRADGSAAGAWLSPA